jgi:YegS/Rv2252/BmrU family lipid kinase
MYYYIINPASGGGKINKVQDKLKDRLKELGIAGEFAKSTGPGDVARLTKMAIGRGYKTIVAVGGDGTINEIINAVGDSGVALGIIPMGSSNELANMLGITDWPIACNILAARKVEDVDLGLINDKLFVTAASIGFDNVLFDLKRNQTTGAFGNFAFNTKLSAAARSFKPIHLEFNFDGKYSVETDCFNFSLSNGAFLSYLPQKSKPQDNMLDAVLISHLNHHDAVKYGQGTLNLAGKLGQVSVFHTKKIKITSKDPVAVSADGKVVAETPVTIEISDRKLKVIVSKKRHF